MDAARNQSSYSYKKSYNKKDWKKTEMKQIIKWFFCLFVADKVCCFPIFRLARKAVLNFLLVGNWFAIAKCRPEFEDCVNKRFSSAIFRNAKTLWNCLPNTSGLNISTTHQTVSGKKSSFLRRRLLYNEHSCSVWNLKYNYKLSTT